MRDRFFFSMMINISPQLFSFEASILLNFGGGAVFLGLSTFFFMPQTCKCSPRRCPLTSLMPSLSVSARKYLFSRALSSLSSPPPLQPLFLESLVYISSPESPFVTLMFLFRQGWLWISPRFLHLANFWKTMNLVRIFRHFIFSSIS